MQRYLGPDQDARQTDGMRFWERWVPVMLPATLALLLAAAVGLVILVSDPNAPPGDDEVSNELGEIFRGPTGN